MSRAPLHALNSFLVAAKLGNLTRAAESLHLTVSALSHQMKALEDRLGQRLLERNARGIRLTPDGQRLLDRIAPHLQAIDLALRPFAARRDQVLSLSILPSMAASWLVPRLGSFVAQHPDIELNLQSSTALVDFERERDLDAALRFGPGRWPGVTAVHLFDDWLTPVASPELLKQFPKRSGHSLDGLPLLGDPGGRWAEWFAEFGGHAPRRYIASFSDTESLHRAAVEGIGVALARMTLVRPMIDNGRLRELSPHCLPAEYAHYLVFPPRSEDHAGLKAFRTWIEAEARQVSCPPGSAPLSAAAMKVRASRKRV